MIPDFLGFTVNTISNWRSQLDPFPKLKKQRVKFHDIQKNAGFSVLSQDSTENIVFFKCIQMLINLISLKASIFSPKEIFAFFPQVKRSTPKPTSQWNIHPKDTRYIWTYIMYLYIYIIHYTYDISVHLDMSIFHPYLLVTRASPGFQPFTRSVAFISRDASSSATSLHYIYIS